MNRRLLTLDETVRYAEYPEMMVDMPGALQRAYQHIRRLERAYEERAVLTETTENRMDDVLARLTRTLKAMNEVLDDPENEGTIPAPLEVLVRNNLSADISVLNSVFFDLNASRSETVEQLAEEF